MILLDTHVLLWVASDPARLSTKGAPGDPKCAPADTSRRRSYHSLGIGMACAKQAYPDSKQRRNFCTRDRILSCAQTNHPEIAALAVRLPSLIPKDPADRLIVSTAAIEGMQLVTADAQIRQAKLVPTIW